MTWELHPATDWSLGTLSVMVTPAALLSDESAPELAAVVPGAPADSASELHRDEEANSDELDAGIMMIIWEDVRAVMFGAVGGADGMAAADATQALSGPGDAAPHALARPRSGVEESPSMR